MASRIVCGIDQTRRTRSAASTGARLARRLGSHAVLVDIGHGGGLLPRAAAAHQHELPVGFDIPVDTSDAASTLLAVAEREDAELMVVAAEGRSVVGTALLGSVCSTLMHDAPCPVVLTRPDAVAPLAGNGARSVVCGVAGDGTDTRLLRLAGDLAKRLGGELHPVHGYGRPLEDRRQAARHRLARALEQASIDAQGMVVALPPADALERAADEYDAALVLVGSKERGRVASIVHGSIASRLAAQARTAVVALPHAASIDPGSGHYELLPAFAGPASGRPNRGSSLSRPRCGP